MSTDEEVLKRRYREFLELMPLTMSIAGLPVSQPPHNYTVEQMELRARTMESAYKIARQLVRQSIAG